MKEKQRVLRIITRMNIGGPARHVRILNDRLGQFGFERLLVAGITSAEEGSLPSGDGPLEVVPELGRRIGMSRDVKALLALYRLIKRYQPAIVHTHMAKAGALGRIAAHLAGVPIVIHTFHGHVLEGYFSKGAASAFRVAEKGLAHWSDSLIAVSPQIRDQLVDLGIGRRGQWRIVPLGLELDSLLSIPIEARPATRQITIGIVGRLVPIKNHSAFFRVARRLLNTHPDLRFVVAGDGELRKPLELEAVKLLGDRVEFRGWVHDLRSLYEELDIVVLSSDNEGTPVALIEASAAGKPVVATNVGGVPEVVRDGESGILVPPGDEGSFARAVSDLIEDSERAARFGQLGRRHVADRYSADRLAADIAALYQELLARQRPP